MFDIPIQATLSTITQALKRNGIKLQTSVYGCDYPTDYHLATYVFNEQDKDSALALADTLDKQRDSGFGGCSKAWAIRALALAPGSYWRDHIPSALANLRRICCCCHEDGSYAPVGRRNG